MEKHTRAEIVVGIFVMVGVVILGYLSVSIGGLSLLPASRYLLHAKFASVGDLKQGASVKIASARWTRSSS